MGKILCSYPLPATEDCSLKTQMHFTMSGDAYVECEHCSAWKEFRGPGVSSTINMHVVVLVLILQMQYLSKFK